MKESKAVTFIGGFYIFGSIIVLLSLIFGGSALSMVFNVPYIPDTIVKLFVVLFFIPSGFLYVKRTRIGYWLVLLSSIVFFLYKRDIDNRIKRSAVHREHDILAFCYCDYGSRKKRVLLFN